MRLIDADALLRVLEHSTETWAKNIPTIRSWWSHAVRIKDNIVALIKSAPTIEAEPVKHAKWEHIVDCGGGNCYGSCSNCHTDHRAQNRTALIASYRYCRWCGAKMDGGADNED